MKQHLELSEDQERDIMPLLEELQEMRGNARFEQQSRMEDLRSLSEDPGSSERDIEEALAGLRSYQRATETRQREVRAEIDRYLTVRQQARMLFFEARFRHNMENRLRGLKRMERMERMEQDRYRESRRRYEESRDAADLDEPF
jgi:hypothetical protein